MRHVKRRGILIACAFLVVALAAATWRAIPILTIGVAYKAKVLCSGVFVSGRASDAVLAELQTDDLAVLRYIRSTTDMAAQSVTATGFGVVSRTAVYREGLGCALALDGLIPSRMPTNASEIVGSIQAYAAPMPKGPAAPALDAVVSRAFSEPDPRRRRRTRAVVIVNDGHVVYERYAPGIAAETRLPGWSMAKSVMNALVGILVERRLLTLDGPVPIPEWNRPGDPRAKITLSQLLQMSSGLEFDERMSSPRSDVMRMLLGVGDSAMLAIQKDLTALPGTDWRYSSGTTGILARIIRNVLPDDAHYLQFPQRALFNRVGMSSAVIETDASGTFVGSSYMYATARDWARFGTLYLQDGVWRGERVLPEGWVAYSTTPAPADPDKRYGAHFWLQIPDEYRGSNQPLPVGTHHAVGHEGQFVTIVPDRRVVIVRLGHTRYPEAWDHSAFVSEVLAALDAGRPSHVP